MAVTMADRYRRWFEYEKDAHAKVLDAMRKASESARQTAAFARAVTLLGHVATARSVWLHRFGETADGPRPEEFFPTGLSLEQLAERVQRMHTLWDTFLARLDDAGLCRTFRYKSFDAGWFENTVEDVLSQLFGHSSYHRGQIASLLKAAGAEPPVTDFIYWARKPVTEK